MRSSFANSLQCYCKCITYCYDHCRGTYNILCRWLSYIDSFYWYIMVMEYRSNDSIDHGIHFRFIHCNCNK